MLRAFFASGEYANAMGDWAAQPPTDLEDFGKDSFSDAMFFDVLGLDEDLDDGFVSSVSMDSSATVAFPPFPAAAQSSPPAFQAPSAQASGAGGYTPAGCALYMQPQLSAPFAPLWAPADSSAAPCFATEAQAVDMLALQREFSVVPAPQPREVAAPAPAAAAGGRPAVSAAMELHSLAAVEGALPWLPTMTEVDGCLLTLNPVMWRDIAPPYRIQVNTGLRAVPAPEEALRTFYGTINPRVITTACSGKRSAGRAHPYRRPTTRAAAAGAEDLQSAASSASGGDAEKEAACPRPVLEEVWLLKRDAAGSRAVADCLHCCGPFDGTVLPEGPAWAGVCSLDVVVRVALTAGGPSVWLKAERRSVQSLAC